MILGIEQLKIGEIVDRIVAVRGEEYDVSVIEFVKVRLEKALQGVESLEVHLLSLCETQIGCKIFLVADCSPGKLHAVDRRFGRFHITLLHEVHQSHDILVHIHPDLIYPGLK